MNNATTNREMLAKRIETHNKYSEKDINEWIFGIIKIKSHESVLDLGCGTGKQLIPIAEKINSTIVGVDISSESLDYIKGKIGNKANIKLILSSMEDAYEKLKQFRFDAAISCFAIYYSKNPEKTIMELKSLLKENGRLFICGPALSNNKALLDLHSEISALPKMHQGFFESFAVPFLKENFKKVEVFEFENPIAFPDVDSLAEYWLSSSLGDKSKIGEFRKAAEKEFKNRRFVTVKKVIGVLALK